MELKRERQLIWANRASFLVAGCAVAAWAPLIPFVQERFSLQEQQLGMLLLCVGIGSICSMPLSGFLAARWGCRTLVYLGTCLLSLCLLAISMVQNIYLMGAVLFCFGVGSVLIDVTSNINAARVELMLKRPIMSGLHGLYSVGGFIGSLCVTFILSEGIDLTTTALLTVVLLLAITVMGCRHLLNSGQTAAQDEASSGKQRIFHPLVILVGGLCFIMFMTEGSMLDWTGVFLRQERNVPIEQAGYGYAAFAIAMTIFRLSGDRLVQFLGRRRTLCFGTLVIFCGYCLAVMVPHPLTSLLGFFFIGVGAANVVLQLISYTVTIEQVSINAAVTLVNSIGFTGILCGPALIGFMAHAIGLPQTFMVISCLVFLVGGICFFLLKVRR